MVIPCHRAAAGGSHTAGAAAAAERAQRAAEAAEPAAEQAAAGHEQDVSKSTINFGCPLN